MTQSPPSSVGSSPSRWVSAFAIFSAIVLLTTTFGALFCFFLPRQYYARVVMEVKSDDALNGLKNTADSQPMFRDSNLQSTQFQIMQSKEILYPVIDDLKLVETWSKQEQAWNAKEGYRNSGRLLPKEEIYGRLQGMLQLQTIRNTDLVEIGVFSPDRIEAANIANAIAVAYQKARQQEQTRPFEKELEQLREYVAFKRKRIEELQAEWAQIQKKENSADSKTEDLEQVYINTRAGIIPTEYIQAKDALKEAEARLADQSLRAKLIKVGTPVKIWEQAEPPTYPAKPNVPIFMAFFLSAGLAAGALLAGLFLALTRRRQPPARAF